MAMLSASGSSTPRVQRTSLRTALFRETLALLCLTVVIVAGATFVLAGAEYTYRVQSQLQSIAQEKAALLETIVSRQREQLSILSHESTLASASALTEASGFRALFEVVGTHQSLISGERSALDPALAKELLDINGTVFRPVMTKEGWTSYIVASPRVVEGTRRGVLVAVFDASPLTTRILHTDYAGSTAEVLLTGETDATILRFDEGTSRVVPVLQTANATPLAAAFSGDEAIASARDYAGIPVLEAYRRVPSIGWSVIVKIDRYEAVQPVLRLAVEIGIAGLGVVLLLSLSTFVLARRIIGPLETITRKLDGLEARHWRFEKTVYTGNELEVVDAAADELTQRLRHSYEHLEDLVRERTEDLRKAHAEDQAVLESMDDGLIVTDDRGTITYANILAIRLVGDNDIVGKSVTSILKLLSREGVPLHDDQHPSSVILRTKSRFAPQPDPQMTLVAMDGRQTPIQVRGTPMLRGKRLYGTVLVLRDITEERRVDRMKSEFISLVSHQLRTPLSSMRWYLEMLIGEDAGALTEEQREYVSQASTSNARMVHLVNALLNVSRIELSSNHVKPEPVNVNELLAAVLKSFDLELKQKSMTGVIEVGTEAISVCSDKALISLIIENLISNAIKYSPEKSAITILLQKNTEARTVTISVRDTGIGIPEVQQKDVGRKLFRASNAQTTDTDGNGLGLYISHVAAESICADLHFDSIEGKGTTFSLTIPMDPKKTEKL